jgi:hypothetical protein
MLRGNREEAVLLAWLHQAGAALDPIQVSSRQMSEMLLGLIDRRTAMRAMARLQADGLVAVTPLGRAGTQYRLDGGALATLLSSFPFESSTAAIMPGWADLKFPLLQRLDAATAEAAPSPEAAPAEACA